MIDSHPHHPHTEPVIDRSASALALISMAHGVNHVQSTFMPMIYPLVLREFGASYGELGVMLGVAGALGGLLQLAAGALGTIVRRHMLLGVGNVLVGVCVLVLALAQNFFQFFLWTVGVRVGGAAQHPVGSSLLAHHFQHKQLGLALATHFSAGNIGTALTPLVAAMLIGLWGWRITTFLFAIPGILAGLALCVWLKDPRETSPQSAQAPSASFWRNNRRAIADRRVRWILLSTVVAAGGSGHGVLMVYLPLYLSHTLGLESTTVGFIFSLLMVGSILGPLLGGRLVDRFNRQWVVLGAYALAALVTLGFPWVAAQSFLLPVSALLLGTAAFTVSPILQTIVAQATEDRVRDIAFALFYTATFMAGAIWSPMIGYLADRFGLGAAFAVMAGSFVMAALCLLPSQLDEVPAESLAPPQANQHKASGAPLMGP